MRWFIFASFALLFWIQQINSELSEKFENNQKFKLLRIWPKNTDQLKFLHELYKSSSEFEFDFWKAPTAVGAFVDLMVGPELSEATEKLLSDKEIEYKVTVDDVQKKIIEKEKSPTASSTYLSKQNLTNLDPLLISFFSKRSKDEIYTSRNKAKYRFGEYHSYDEMIKWMEEIERQYPRLAKVFNLGTSVEGRPIKGIKLGSPIESTTKRAVWVDGGIHAREWAAIHTALYFIEQLVSNYQVDPQVTAYLDTLNFYITPVANPDGFEYSRSDVTPQTRFWRKNRGGITCTKDRWHRERCCGGIDLNRNFDFHFGETGSSNDICSDIYQGPSAFSEPESRAIRDKLFSSELWGKVDAFITLHTYSQMWIHPYNHERRSFPADIDDLQEVGRRGVDAIEAMYGTKFRFGTGADILYPSSGGSDDWAKAKANIKYVYLLELRPGEEQWDGFLLDRKQLIPTGRETWEGVKAVFDAVLKKARLSSPPSRPFVAVATTTTPRPTTTTQRLTTPRPTTTARFIATTSTPAPLALVTRPVIRSRIQTNNNNNANTVHSNNNAQSNTNLRSTLHERFNRLRQQQLKARREYEARIAQQREYERQQQIQQQLQQQSQFAPMSNACFDRSRWCEAWIQSSPGICITSTIYMQKDCARSCRFCV